MKSPLIDMVENEVLETAGLEAVQRAPLPYELLRLYRLRHSAAGINTLSVDPFLPVAKTVRERRSDLEFTPG